jgi:hypothetical protein
MQSNIELEFMFFVAEVRDANVSDLRAALILAESKLAKGSRIDVWADTKFWEARITSIRKTGFAFKYCGGMECGYVKREHFQTMWRFPVENARQVVLAEKLEKVTNPATQSL